MHDCAPALTVEEYFSTGPPHERPVFDAVSSHLAQYDDVYVELVSVGIFFKRKRVFVQLRPMRRWVQLGVLLPRKADDPRIARKVIDTGRSFYHVLNIAGPRGSRRDRCEPGSTRPTSAIARAAQQG